MDNLFDLFYGYNWIQFFVSIYNDTTFDTYFIKNDLMKER